MNVLPTTSKFARGSVNRGSVQAVLADSHGVLAMVLTPTLKSPQYSVSVLIASAPITPSSFQLELENSTVGASPVAPETTVSQTRV